jgi:MoaA/NifB/PqqE/SkfB family radical SAM enzyme
MEANLFKLIRSDDIYIRSYGSGRVVLSLRNGIRLGLSGQLATVLWKLVDSVDGLSLRYIASQKNAFTGEMRSIASMIDAILTELDKAEPMDYETVINRVPGLMPHSLKERVPLFAGMDLTYVCNLRCKHCYVLHKVSEPKPEQIDEKTAYRVIDSLVELGCLDLTLTGGEITLHPRYRDVLSYAKDQHLYTILKTNGITMTERRANEYAEDPANETHLSLYGSTAEVHDEMTVLPGSFNKTLAGMRELSKAGVRCKINILVWERDADQIVDACKLVEDMGHAPNLEDVMHGRLNGDQSPRSLRISTETRAKLTEQGILQPFSPDSCSAGMSKLKIYGNGGISACELIPHSFGNLFQQSLAEIWYGMPFSDFSHQVMGASQLSAKEFPILSNRNACPGLNILNTGQMEGQTQI